MDMLTPDTSLALMKATESRQSAQLDALKGARKIQSEDQLEAAAKDFEAMFLSEMMKPMFEGLGPNELTGGGKSEEVFFGMLLQEYGKMMAETGQLGIADAVKQELIKMQESVNG